MNKNEIIRVQTTAIAIPFHKPVTLSFGVVAGRSYVVVQIFTNQGIVGIGESAPLPIYSEESVETVKAVTDRYLAPALTGMDPFDIERILARMDTVIKGNPVAKAGIEYALWDVCGKTLDVPAYQLMGGLYRDRVSLPIHSIGIGETKEVVRQAEAQVAMGMKLVKMKIGLDPGRDVAAVRAVRRAIGDDVGLYADANQGYSSDQAMKALKRLEEFNLLRIEQPISKYDIAGMAELCRAVETPIMADEAVTHLHSVHQLVRNRAADVINIKSCMHGVTECKRIAAYCLGSGVPCYRGSMASLGICDAADVHLVASTPNIIYPEDPGANRPEELVDTVVKERLQPVKGMIEVPRRPGLGVELDEKKLDEFKLDL